MNNVMNVMNSMNSISTVQLLRSGTSPSFRNMKPTLQGGTCSSVAALRQPYQGNMQAVSRLPNYVRPGQKFLLNPVNSTTRRGISLPAPGYSSLGKNEAENSPQFGPLNSYEWPMKYDLWTMNYEIWTMNYELWTTKREFGIPNYELWTMKYEQWTMNYEL